MLDKHTFFGALCAEACSIARDTVFLLAALLCTLFKQSHIVTALSCLLPCLVITMMNAQVVVIRVNFVMRAMSHITRKPSEHFQAALSASVAPGSSLKRFAHLAACCTKQGFMAPAETMLMRFICHFSRVI